jgi:hypothetical protein
MWTIVIVRRFRPNFADEDYEALAAAVRDRVVDHDIQVGSLPPVDPRTAPRSL